MAKNMTAVLNSLAITGRRPPSRAAMDSLQQSAAGFCSANGLPPPVLIGAENLQLSVRRPARGEQAVHITGIDSDPTKWLVVVAALARVLPQRLAWMFTPVDGLAAGVLTANEFTWAGGSPPSRPSEEEARLFVTGRTATRAPLGYRKASDDSLLHGDPSETELVRFVFDLYGTDGLYRGEICDVLNAERVPTCGHGRIWSAATINSLVTDVRYIGGIRLGPLVRHGCHPPLVSPSLFRKAQSRLKEQILYYTRNYYRLPCSHFSAGEQM